MSALVGQGRRFVEATEMRNSAGVVGKAANAIGSVSPIRWYEGLPSPHVTHQFDGATLRCFDGTGPTIEQPALNENVVAIHLGGPKRVTRWQGSCQQTWDVPSHAITLMPAFRANRWHTEGVIAYAHLTLGSERLSRLAREEFDREPEELLLLDRVGVADPLIAELMSSLIYEATTSGASRLYRESLLTVLFITVLKRHSTLASNGLGAETARGTIRGGLAGWQLRRVLEHMQANAARDIGVDELVGITGLSRSQFFRAFRASTGDTPACHMQRLRMRYAGTLLQQSRPVGDVAGLLGYVNRSHFSAAFSRVHGVSPSAWRRMQKAGASRQCWRAEPVNGVD
jgi:AraC family transcriptional regulator